MMKSRLGLAGALLIAFCAGFAVAFFWKRIPRVYLIKSHLVKLEVGEWMDPPPSDSYNHLRIGAYRTAGSVLHSKWKKEQPKRKYTDIMVVAVTHGYEVVGFTEDDPQVLRDFLEKNGRSTVEKAIHDDQESYRKTEEEIMKGTSQNEPNQSPDPTSGLRPAAGHL